MELTAEDRKALQDVMNMLSGVLQQSPEVPEQVVQWPEDDTTLREYLWLDWTGNHVWVFEPTANHPRRWVKRQRYGGDYMGEESRPDGGPFVRTTDPSLPRTWGTLDDVPEDVERATGDYVGMRRELARSPLSESGWFLLLKDGPYGGWVELLIDRTKYVTSIREGQVNE